MQDIYTKAILKCCSEKTKESGPHSGIPLPSQIIPKSKIFLSIILLKAKGHEKQGPPAHILPGHARDYSERLGQRSYAFPVYLSNWKWFPSEQHGSTIQDCCPCPPSQWICTYLLIYSPGSVCCSFSTACYRQSHRNRIRSVSLCQEEPSLPAPGPHRFQLSAENPALPARLQPTAQQGHTNKLRAQGREETGQGPPKLRLRIPQSAAPEPPKVLEYNKAGSRKTRMLKKAQILGNLQQPSRGLQCQLTAYARLLSAEKKAREIHCLLLSSK